MGSSKWQEFAKGTPHYFHSVRSFTSQRSLILGDIHVQYNDKSMSKHTRAADFFCKPQIKSKTFHQPITHSLCCLARHRDEQTSEPPIRTVKEVVGVEERL